MRGPIGMRDGGKVSSGESAGQADFRPAIPGVFRHGRGGGRERWVGIWRSPASMGFDVDYTDGIRGGATPAG